MITQSEFKELIERPESTTLDFKRQQYKLNDNSFNKTDEFIKDVVCFANTIREETAYIIIGISNENGNKELVGIDFDIDDATFQQKIKDKVNPKPQFLYYTIDFENKKFGIIEIPVVKYSEPIISIVKMKGLEVGRVYFRRGSSNEEAIGREVIFISKWLESIPAPYQSNSIIEDISSLLSKTTSQGALLSNCISEGLIIAKKYNLESLYSFCNGELQGWSKNQNEEDIDYLNYRTKEFILSPSHMNLEVPPYYSSNPIQLYNEIKEINMFHERTIIFTEPIFEIENALTKMEENGGNMLYIKKINSILTLADGAKKTESHKMYAIRHNFEVLYSSIKQRFIDELLKTN